MGRVWACSGLIATKIQLKLQQNQQNWQSASKQELEPLYDTGCWFRPFRCIRNPDSNTRNPSSPDEATIGTKKRKPVYVYRSTTTDTNYFMLDQLPSCMNGYPE